MEAKQMSQVPVKWVYETFDEKPPFIPANGSHVVSAPLDHDILPHAVVPLSALREKVVEGLKQLADPFYGPSEELREWNRVKPPRKPFTEWLAQRLLASLGEVKDVPEIGFGNRKEMGHE